MKIDMQEDVLSLLLIVPCLFDGSLICYIYTILSLDAKVFSSNMKSIKASGNLMFLKGIVLRD
jgi:hypothetical protein